MFKDRKDAGQKLAQKLEKYAVQKPLILSLPRGGVVLGYYIAEKLKAPLDTIVARKLSIPDDPEFGIGAIAPNDVVVLNEEALRLYGISEEILQEEIVVENRVMERRIEKYKSGQYAKGKAHGTIIVVDDGVATGATAQAALMSVRKIYDPKTLVFATPVSAKSSLNAIEKLADEVVCLLAPERLDAIGIWYENFEEVIDEDVVSCLEKAKNNLHPKR